MQEVRATKQTGLEDVARIIARGSVIAGGLFWIVAAFSGPFIYHGVDLPSSLKIAMWPFMAAAVTLLIGWFYERLAALLLVAASAAVLLWGTLYQWEPGLWLIMGFVLIAPMALAALLFFLAARLEADRAPLAEEPHVSPASMVQGTRSTGYPSHAAWPRTGGTQARSR